MTVRLILLATLAVALVLGGALLLLDDAAPAPNVAAPGSASAAAPDGAMELPANSEGRPDAADRGPLAELGGQASPLRGSAIDPQLALAGPGTTSTVSGRLFDVSGSPIAGEPVGLLADDDHWQARLASRLGPDVLDRSRSGADGRFSLAARAGVRLVLVAGGQRYPRLVLDPVAAGDALVLTLQPGLSISGSVVSAESLMPVPDAYVGVASGDDQFRAQADGEGRFVLMPLAEGALHLGAWAPGYDMLREDERLAGSSGVQLELPPGRLVQGSVVDADTGAPVPAAQVTLLVISRSRPAGEPDPPEQSQVLHELSATADASGVFRFESAPSRSFRLEVRAEGYVNTVRKRWEQRVLAPDEQIVLKLVAERVISGQVLDGPAGDPVAGALVTLAAPSGELARGTSGADGAFALPFSEWSGVGPLLVDALDAEGRFARDFVRRGDEGLLLTLTEPLDLTVQVSDSEGPVQGAHVALTSKDVDPTLGVTNEQGQVQLSHRLAGADIQRVSAWVRHGARASLRVEVDLSQGRPVEPLQVDLERGACVQGRVVGPAGVGIPAALVKASAGLFARTNAEGYFELAPIDPEFELIELHVSAEGLRQAEAEALPDQRDVLVVLEPSVSWALHVTDGSSGLALDGVGGRLQRESLSVPGKWHHTSERLSATPGVAGGYTVRLPEVGRYRLTLGLAGRIPVASLPIDFGGLREPAPLDVVMFRAAVLELSVLDTGGRPVSGVELVVVEVFADELALQPKALGKLKPKREVNKRRSNSAGRASFNLGEGGYVQVALGKRSWALPRALLVFPGAPTPCTVRVPAGGDLLLDVRDQGGAPLDRGSVSVRSVGKQRPFDLRRSLHSSAQGQALFEQLPEATYHVRVFKRGFVRHDEELWVGPGLTRLSVRMQRGTPSGKKSSAGGKKKIKSR